MTKTKTYDFHSDTSHAWLAVPRAEIKALGLEKQISNSSYEKDGIVYLEEDNDFLKFVAASKRIGIEVKWNELDQVDPSPIRDYPSYRQ